jgi:hypothetical protein
MRFHKDTARIHCWTYYFVILTLSNPNPTVRADTFARGLVAEPCVKVRTLTVGLGLLKVRVWPQPSFATV